jgi:hypothetical protein
METALSEVSTLRVLHALSTFFSNILSTYLSSISYFLFIKVHSEHRSDRSWTFDVFPLKDGGMPYTLAQCGDLYMNGGPEVYSTSSSSCNVITLCGRTESDTVHQSSRG